MRHIGLLGCGRIGQVHAANVAAGLEHGAQLVFCSESGISAQRLQSKFGGRVCGDLSAMLGMPEVAAVIIATPPHLHAVQAIECLQAGKSVLVEKPLCTTLVEVEQMERAAAVAAPCFAMVAENYYYKPSLQSMKELIASGRLGGLRRVRVRKMTRQLDAGWKSGYGALLEGGIHFVALISDLVDCALAAAPDSPLSPIAVEADFPSRDSADAVERHSVTGWRYDGDVTASLHYAWDVPSLLRGTFQHSYIEGDAGRILFESNGLYLHFKGAGSGTKVCGPRLGDLMGYGAMTRDFLACLAEPGRRPYSDLARARRDLRIVLAAYGYAESIEQAEDKEENG